MFNTGLYVLGSATATVSSGGNLTMTGIGGTGTALNEGVRLVSGALSGTSLTLSGTAHAATTGVLNTGIYMLVTNIGGVSGGTITGAGGGTTSSMGNVNHGIYMQAIGGYATEGAFPGTVTGTAGFGASSLPETGNFFA